ncbi:hypothetical protein DDB_G0280709 [Dictyostelium discoideum AX4]|nr:hypothetical protein DDB_G0280709 [Dictyostelium discoideum AX4]EAL67156.1 hypothetical protein DDB_G0280709 [Dictyostelium discoideum AX4]|eukprot:XP_641136.1 hypothetical protein DDB_G0280709 [Dictyostelium discoideum AX4]
MKLINHLIIEKSSLHLLISTIHSFIDILLSDFKCNSSTRKCTTGMSVDISKIYTAEYGHLKAKLDTIGGLYCDSKDVTIMKVYVLVPLTIVLNIQVL